MITGVVCLRISCPFSRLQTEKVSGEFPRPRNGVHRGFQSGETNCPDHAPGLANKTEKGEREPGAFPARTGSASLSPFSSPKPFIWGSVTCRREPTQISTLSFCVPSTRREKSRDSTGAESSRIPEANMNLITLRTKAEWSLRRQLP